MRHFVSLLLLEYRQRLVPDAAGMFVHVDQEGRKFDTGAVSVVSPESFDATLRKLRACRKFSPIVVELAGGKRIVIRKRKLAFAGGVAGFIDGKSGALVEFSHKEVTGIRTNGAEVES